MAVSSPEVYYCYVHPCNAFTANVLRSMSRRGACSRNHAAFLPSSFLSFPFSVRHVVTSFLPDLASHICRSLNWRELVVIFAPQFPYFRYASLFCSVLFCRYFTPVPWCLQEHDQAEGLFMESLWAATVIVGVSVTIFIGVLLVR